MREILYNIESFRADALNLPDINQKTTKSLASKTKANNGKNATVGGGNSLTGKNPFTILKAAAIASPTSATFPNNF